MTGTIPLSQSAVNGHRVKYGLGQRTFGLLENFWTVFWTTLWTSFWTILRGGGGEGGQVTNFLYQRRREGENHNNAINI